MNEILFGIFLGASIGGFYWVALYAIQKRWEAEFYRRQCERLRDELADIHIEIKLEDNRHDNLQDDSTEADWWKDN